MAIVQFNGPMLIDRLFLPRAFLNAKFSSIIDKPTFVHLARAISERGDTIQSRFSSITPFLRGNTTQKLNKIYELSNSCHNLEKLLVNERDVEMKDLYKSEIFTLKSEIAEYDNQLLDSYFNFINDGIESVLVEIRAGTGGAEAALFASELVDAYKLYFDFKNWDYAVVSESIIGAHTREVIMSVDKNCFAQFSGETGVHRVQRVPETESQGRIHTSTVSVAVIPQKFRGDNSLDEKDVRMDVYRSSGPGGQNVNKTNSAVRLVHIPTGITVCMQDERSQVENRIRAMKVLKSRIEERARITDQKSTKAIRTEQIGCGERSDKIRTYNFPQNRITDHRTSYTYQNLELFFENPNILEEFVSRFQYFKLSQIITNEEFINKV